MGHKRRGRTADDAEHRFADWSCVYLGLSSFLQEAASFRGLPAPPAPDGTASLLSREERVFLALAGAHLIEPRPTGGRVFHGCFLEGTVVPTSVDVGDLLVTDRRALLCGTAGRREWPFADLVALYHDPDAPWSALSVRGQAVVSGVFYGHADVYRVRFRLMLALAVNTGTVGRLRRELKAALTEHLARRPPLPGDGPH